MGICTSLKNNNKKIKAKNIQPKEPNNNEDDKKGNDEENKNKSLNKKNSEEEEKRTNEKIEPANEPEKSDMKGKRIIDSDRNPDSSSIIDDDSEKKKNTNILIKYLTDGKLEFEKVYFTNENISTLFNILLEKKSKYCDYDLLTKEYLSLMSKLNQKISDIFPEQDEAELTLFYLGLDISDDVKKDYETSCNILGVPLFDLGGEVGLLLYNIVQRSFTSELVKDKKLARFNHLSSFCNGKDTLFLSGGEINDKKGKENSISDFCSVDLLNSNTINKLPNLKTPRAWHSMIYIPKKYVFIVGGGTKTVELYDQEKNSITEDSQMKEIRNECTLCCMNNAVLYAFCGISIDGTFISTVEKCILRNNKRTWSYVEYTTADNTLFEECFYVSSYFSDTSIILFATNEDENKEHCSILFDLEDEESPIISYYGSEMKIIDVCPEKIFHPMNNSTAILIPLIGTMAKTYEIDASMKLSEKQYPDALRDIMG